MNEIDSRTEEQLEETELSDLSGELEVEESSLLDDETELMEEQRFSLELSRRQLDRWEEQEELDFETCVLLKEELGNE